MTSPEKELISHANVPVGVNFKMRNSHRYFSMTWNSVCAGVSLIAQFVLSNINDLHAQLRRLFI
jgi:hypothetical protein